MGKGTRLLVYGGVGIGYTVVKLKGIFNIRSVKEQEKALWIKSSFGYEYAPNEVLSDVRFTR